MSGLITNNTVGHAFSAGAMMGEAVRADNDVSTPHECDVIPLEQRRRLPPDVDSREKKNTARAAPHAGVRADTPTQARDSDAMPRDGMPSDPLLLAMMVALQVLDTASRNADSLGRQLTRATDLQVFLREKQVELYQEQINKAIEQEDQARKAALVNIVFDWIVAAAETGYGMWKVVEGTATANPLELADGAAFILAGTTGIVKVGAEIVLVLGADKEKCNTVIRYAGTAQSTCECAAMALDILQISQKIVCATRAVVPAVEAGLAAGAGESLAQAVIAGSQEEIAHLTEQLAQEVSKNLGRNFGMAMEIEMVDVAEMASEAAKRGMAAEKNMVRSMGRSFTRDGVAAMIKTSVADAANSLLHHGEKGLVNALNDAILQRLRRQLMMTVLSDASMHAILVTRAVAGGVTKISAGVVGLKEAALRKRVEALIVQQGFNDFIDNWTEDRKKNQQKQLHEYLQNGTDVLIHASAVMDDSGTVMAKVAAGCA